MKKTEAGFTVIELLVAIQITLLIVGLIFSGYFFSLRISKSWQNRVMLENAVSNCQRVIANDLISAGKIVSARERELVLLDAEGRRIEYRFADAVFSRNTVPLTTPGIGVEAVKFRYARSQYDDLGSAGADGALNFFAPLSAQDTAEIAFVEFEVRFIHNNKRLGIKSLIAPRNAFLNVFASL